MSYSQIAGLGRIVDLPPGTTMPSAKPSSSGITGGWVLMGDAMTGEYVSVQTALKYGHVRRRTYAGGESESVIFPGRERLKMTAAAAISAGLIDSTAATVIAAQPGNRAPFADQNGDDNWAQSYVG